MRPFLALGVAALLYASARADDSISPETLTAVKNATVYIKIQRGETPLSSGTGFVVSTSGEQAIIVTNSHVVVPPTPSALATVPFPNLPPGFPRVPRPSMRPSPAPVEPEKMAPRDLTKLIKSATVVVVFRSGTKSEQRAVAEVLAADPVEDLAVLRVKGVKELPKPIDPTGAKDLIETTPVYSFGFPFGEVLSTSKGSPAVTVGKGTISSLRTNDAGELALVQIDGNLNPGNSGGPVVDAKGRLVGVAVAIIKNSNGVGLAVPVPEVGKILAGRLGKPHATLIDRQDGRLSVRVEIPLLDPHEKIESVSLLFLPRTTKGIVPLALQKDHQRIGLKLDPPVAVAEFPIDKPAPKNVLLQAAFSGAGGASGVTTIFTQELSPPIPFTVPTIASGPNTADGDTPVAGGVIGSMMFRDAAPEGGILVGFEVGLGNWLGVDVVRAVRPVYRVKDKDALGEQHGTELDRVVKAIAKPGYAVGAINANTGTTVNGFSVTFMKVVGDKLDPTDAYESDWIAGKTGGIRRFGGDGRLVYGIIGKKDEKNVTGLGLSMQRGAKSGDIDTAIHGGHGSPLSVRDVAPPDGLLVGLEAWHGKWFNIDVIGGIQPIFRVGEKESLGEHHGTSAKSMGKVVAKPGYAVGAVTVQAGAMVDGICVTFMKVKDGRLDPADAYDSEWIGGKGDNPQKLGGTGAPIIGIVGKKDHNQFNGLGLALRGSGTSNSTDSALLGGGFSPIQFRDTAPAGGLLVGFEVGLGKFFDNDVVRAIRPVYRTGDKESLGTQHGTELDRVVKAIAKPGYAVGAVTVKVGLTVDGISVTFMKVVNGKLDPKDSYESEWIGGQGGGPPQKLGGTGVPVIGIIGKKDDKNFTGLGLSQGPVGK